MKKISWVIKNILALEVAISLLICYLSVILTYLIFENNLADLLTY